MQNTTYHLRRIIMYIHYLLPGLIAALFTSLLLKPVAVSAQTDCTGCLCAGNPCRLCPLPPVKNAPPVPDEPDTCVRIKENVSPTAALPGMNEYFPKLDKSIMECVRNGGDVIRNRNSRNNREFPFRFYCKPSITAARSGTK